MSNLLVACVFLLALLLVGGRFIGIHVYTVLSGSMEPAYHTGSLIFVKEKNAADLEVGDVITFQLVEDTVATHRIIEIVQDEEKQETVHFRTKGDANEVADGALVDCDDVIGKVMFTIPHMGYVLNYIKQPSGLYLTASVGALFLMLTFLAEQPLRGSNKNKEREI